MWLACSVCASHCDTKELHHPKGKNVGAILQSLVRDKGTVPKDAGVQSCDEEGILFLLDWNERRWSWWHGGRVRGVDECYKQRRAETRQQYGTWRRCLETGHRSNSRSCVDTQRQRHQESLKGNVYINLRIFFAFIVLLSHDSFSHAACIIVVACAHVHQKFNIVVIFCGQYVYLKLILCQP